MRSAIAALMVIAAAAPIAAQASRPATQSFADKVLGLESGDPLRIAWSAHAARAAPEARIVSHLRNALATLCGPGPSGVAELAELDDRRRFAGLHVLDALLACEARVVHAEVRPFLAWEWSRVPALALLARNARANLQFFVEAFADPNAQQVTFETLVCGNALAELKAPAFAAQLLERVQQLELVLKVVDVGQECWNTVVGFGGGVGCGPCTLMVPEAFPPTPFFRLTDSVSSDASATTRQINGMAQPVWMRRQVRSGTKLRFSSCQASASGGREFSWLADLLRCQVDELGIRATSFDTLYWKGGPTLVRDVIMQRVQLRVAFSRVVERLEGVHALTATEARAARCEMIVKVSDARQERQVPLPRLPSLFTVVPAFDSEDNPTVVLLPVSRSSSRGH